jgi:hypothetical protein
MLLKITVHSYIVLIDYYPISREPQAMPGPDIPFYLQKYIFCFKHTSRTGKYFHIDAIRTKEWNAGTISILTVCGLTIKNIPLHGVYLNNIIIAK